MRTHRIFAASALLWLALAACPALYAQEEGVYTIPRFEFEGGAALENMKVGYVLHGKRDPQDRNVIVLLAPTSGFKSWANAHIGKGKAFDPEKYFIVSIDAIGGGTSSQPRDGLGTRFPAYGIRDSVRAAHELLEHGLGIRHALAVGGASSGAYQALEWGIMYPAFAKGLLLYSGSAQPGRHVRLIIDTIVATLSLDPAFAPGNSPVVGSDAVRRAAIVYFPWLISDQALGLFDSDDALTRAQSGFADNWAKNWDAVGLAWRYKSNLSYDAAAPFHGDLNEALKRVTAAVLILPSTSDRTHPIEMNEAMRKAMVNARVVYAPLDSPRGHSAVFRPPGTPEYDFVSSQTRDFLASLK